jgi:hypothetical protein
MPQKPNYAPGYRRCQLLPPLRLETPFPKHPDALIDLFAKNFWQNNRIPESIRGI